jgi:hypothetical protein
VSFGRPGWLWLLLLAAPIVALFLVRRRARPVEVSSLLLWSRVLADEARRSWLGTLREFLALALNLAILAAVTLAAAGPARVTAEEAPETWLIVLDGGAAMAAPHPDGGTRFDRAREEAAAVIACAARTDRIALVRAGPSPTLLAPVGATREMLLRALEDAAPGPGVADLDAATSLVGGADRIVVIGGEDPGSGAFVGTGDPAVNVGITDVDAARERDGPGTRITVRLANAGSEAARREIVVRGPEGRRASVMVDLAPGEKAERTVLLEPASEGLATVLLEPSDVLPADDRATVPVAPRRRLRILALAELPPFLAAALEAAGDAVDAGSGRVDAIPSPLPPNTVVLVAGREPPTGAESAWILDAPGGEPRDAPAVTGWSSAHPVLRGLDLGNLGLRRARPIAPSSGEVALVTAEGGAIVTADETDDRRVLRFRFRLEDGNLPVLAAFPLMVRNALAWFARETPRLFPASLRRGEPLEPLRPLPAEVREVWLAGPAVATPSRAAVRDGRVSIRPDLKGQGLLLVRAGPWRERVAVHDRPPEVVAVPGDASRGELPGDRSGRPPPDPDLAPPILAAAALLLLLEWWWHQRTRRVR